MMNRDNLIETVRTLRMYLPHLVLCGGWTLFVYRHWIEGEGPEPIRTFRQIIERLRPVE